MRGVTGEPLRTVCIGRVNAIVGRVRAVPTPTDANLRRYDRLMSALWHRVPALLPARFGTSARDLADLEVMVRGRERVVRSRLRAVRNRAQMTVRLVTQDEQVGRTSPKPFGEGGSGRPGEPAAGAVARPTGNIRQTGTQYLRSRQREYSAPAFDPLRAAVRRWVREERVEKQGGVATIYHLIPRGSADRYRLTIGDAAREAGVRMIVSGPWPPYAFADIW